MTDKELMQQALIKAAKFAIKALDEEAAAYGPKDRIAHVDEAAAMLRAALEETVASPSKPWVGLTDDEIKGIIGSWGDTPIKGYTRKLFDQIETKLKEKNYD
jgi:hypothetical protein